MAYPPKKIKKKKYFTENHYKKNSLMWTRLEFSGENSYFFLKLFILNKEKFWFITEIEIHRVGWQNFAFSWLV